MKMRALLLLVSLPFAAAAAAAALLPLIQVDPTTNQFIDSFGRVRIFHGVNAVAKIPPWLPVQSGFDTTTTLSDLDAKNLSEVFGFTAVRLGFMWPGAAPRPPPAAFDDVYIENVRSMVDTLGSYGIHTILDAHQDIYNRRWCGEGAPDWATCGLPPYTQPFPMPAVDPMPVNATTGYPPLEDCLKRDFGVYYFSDAVGKSFQALYDNVICPGQSVGLRDAFAEFWAHAATKFSANTNVLGYELINEPWAGDVVGDPKWLLPGLADKKNLVPMYTQLHKAIRASDNDHIIFFEHTLVDIIGQSGFSEGPGGPAYNNRQALSYHIYCAPANSSGDPGNLAHCDAEDEFPFQMSLADVTRLGCGGMMTEFGAMGEAAIGEKNLDFLTGLADTHLQSWTYWQYKYFHDLTTAGSAESFYSPDGKLQAGKVRTLVRTYAQAIQGKPDKMTFDPASRNFELVFVADPAIKAPTIIFASQDFYYTSDFDVTVQPASACTVTRPRRNFVEIISNAATKVTVRITAKSS